MLFALSRVPETADETVIVMSSFAGTAIAPRFAASLLANTLRSGISFVTVLLLARWLGPEDYGRFAFLLATFAAVKQLLDMASSSAFFTFLSRQQRSRRFVGLYWRWVGIQFLLSLALIVLLLPDSVVAGVWKGESRTLVVLAMIAAFMQNMVWPIASQMAEAQRETIRVQRLNTMVVLIHLIVVSSLWVLGKLALPLLFLAIAIEWGVASWLASHLYRCHSESANHEAEARDTVSSVWSEFWHYCLPFVPYAWVGFLHDFADRWMLQHWGGATEQAYYSVAQQFSMVALLATASILRIFWKEIAEAHHQGNMKRVEHLYHRVSRGLYFVAAVVAGGLLPWSEEILRLTVGAMYIGGAVTLGVMLLYPVHQSLGQIGGTMLYATAHTRLQVILGIGFMTSGLVVAYLALAPKDALVPGLGLASEGLAWKMVVMQLIQVNILAWIIARVFGWRYDWIYQFLSLGVTVTVGWVAKLISVSLWATPDMVAMLVSGLIYVLSITTLLYFMPGMAGMSRGVLVRSAKVAIRSVLPGKRDC